jgi:aminomethyltransferase
MPFSELHYFSGRDTQCQMMMQTPLFSAHQRLGGKIIEFGGWAMPVQYTSIMDEHQAVRQAAGIFDISHMGEITVRGAAAKAFLNQALTNDVSRLIPGLGQYTLMCNELGGAIDDLYIYCLAPEDYLLIVNASRIPIDFTHLHGLWERFPDKAQVELRNISDETGAVAVQGPAVPSFIDQLVIGTAAGGASVTRPSDLKKNQIAAFRFAQGRVWISRTGYTGEDGVEIVSPASQIEAVWNLVLKAGEPSGIKPAGLGARDTLRTEVCYPLYGHELDEKTSPIEAGLGFFVSFDKGEFVGRAALARQKAEGPVRKLVAFKMIEKAAPPRPHYGIWSAGQQVGEVCSGTQSPSLSVGIGLGYVPSALAKTEASIEIEARGKRARALIVPKPIYRKAN